MTAEQQAADDVVGAAEAAIAVWQRKHAVTTQTAKGRWGAAAEASMNNHELEAAQKVLADAQAKAREAADAADANQITYGCTATVHATGVVREVLVPQGWSLVKKEARETETREKELVWPQTRISQAD